MHKWAAGILVGGFCFALAQLAGAQEEGWESLFNGKDLTGWKVGDAEQSQIQVQDGMIVAKGPRAHIFTEREFKNFEFKADVRITPGSNSGLYFHTHYQETGFPSTGIESQVNVSHRDPVKTGSLYHIIRLYETPAKDDEWYTQYIKVEGRRIVVKVNDKIVVDYTQPEGVTQQPCLGSGSFAIQAHDPKSVTYYKNIFVKALPD